MNLETLYSYIGMGFFWTVVIVGGLGLITYLVLKLFFWLTGPIM